MKHQRLGRYADFIDVLTFGVITSCRLIIMKMCYDATTVQHCFFFEDADWYAHAHVAIEWKHSFTVGIALDSFKI